MSVPQQVNDFITKHGPEPVYNSCTAAGVGQINNTAHSDKSPVRSRRPATLSRKPAPARSATATRRRSAGVAHSLISARNSSDSVARFRPFIDSGSEGLKLAKSTTRRFLGRS